VNSVTKPSESSFDAPDVLALTRSLELFRQVSGQLGESEELLQVRVAELKGQLAEAGELRRQELEEKERLAQRLQSVLDLLPGGVIVIDGQGVVRDANPVALELLSEPLVGHPWREVIARCFAPRRDDGHEISLRNGRRLSIATRSLAGEPGQLVLLTDLTETRRLQDQLARHERLSSLGRMVASLAHQIRTPLSTALLYASHLEQGGLSEQQQQRFAGNLKARLHELEHQVRDMLIFARGDLPLNDRLSPAALLSALRSAAEPRLQSANVRWQCDVQAAEVLCNRDTLVGALLNLIENALQACAEAPRLKIHMYRRGETLRVCISDRGNGIDAETLSRLGEPFFTTRTTGTGLGLAVAKAVARAHQGELQLRSRPGRGTCALVKLPLIPSSHKSE
jgi:two-component system sensor histidine kinase FlrB